MISIGNDIVAFEYTNPEKTRQERFYSRILFEGERELYNSKSFNPLSFENFVWLVWSVKESVYKFHKRHHRHILFAPTKISVKKIQIPLKPVVFNLSGEREGVSISSRLCYCCKVNFGSTVFFTRSFLYDKMIFTVANNTEYFDNVFWGIKAIEEANYATQSREVKTFALNRLRKILVTDHINIEKAAAGYPEIATRDNIPLSFSHHGRFVGYAFVKN